MSWRCERCREPHDADDPPCEACGHDTFERAVVPADGTVDTGPQYVWVCPNCGREHVRNVPPCSRCGEPRLEQVDLERRYADLEPEAPGYLEVAKPYLPIVLVVAVVLALFATGVLPSSWLPGVAGQPSPPDAPGESEVAGGLDLAAVERGIHERLEDARADESRRYDDGLAALAAYRNAQLADARYDGGDPGRAPPLEEFDTTCGGDAVGAPLESAGGSIDDYGDEPALAAALADGLESALPESLAAGYDAEGVDVRVGPDPGREVVVFYATC